MSTLERILSGISERGAAGVEAFTGLQKGYGAGALAGREMTLQEYLAEKKAIQDLVTTAGGEGLLQIGGKQAKLKQIMGIIGGEQVPEGMEIAPRYSEREYADPMSYREWVKAGGKEGTGYEYGKYLTEWYRPKKLPTTPAWKVRREDSIESTKIYLNSLKDAVRLNPFARIPDISEIKYRLGKGDFGIDMSIPEVIEMVKSIKITQPTKKTPGSIEFIGEKKTDKRFGSEKEAREVGKKRGDIIYLEGIGTVQLK